MQDSLDHPVCSVPSTDVSWGLKSRQCLENVISSVPWYDCPLPDLGSNCRGRNRSNRFVNLDKWINYPLSLCHPHKSIYASFVVLLIRSFQVWRPCERCLYYELLQGVTATLYMKGKNRRLIYVTPYHLINYHDDCHHGEIFALSLLHEHCFQVAFQ